MRRTFLAIATAVFVVAVAVSILVAAAVVLSPTPAKVTPTASTALTATAPTTPVVYTFPSNAPLFRGVERADTPASNAASSKVLEEAKAQLRAKALEEFQIWVNPRPGGFLHTLEFRWKIDALRQLQRRLKEIDEIK